MNGIKTISIVYFFIALFIPNIYTQQQQHIIWPSLADSPWPVGRGDAQATGRSEYFGPSTPNVIWRKDMPFGIFYGPVVGFNDDLFVGTHALNGNGGENYFYAINKNGEDIWIYMTQGNRANLAGPTITIDGTIYFGSLGTTTSGTGGIYALNPDGTLKWRNKSFIIGLHRRFISVTKNHKIYIPWADTLYILEPENGNVIDSLYLPGIYGKEIVFSTGGDTIFYISPGGLNAAKTDGEFLWSFSLGNNSGVPVVDNENKIYLYGSHGGGRYLFCINPNGSVNWQFPIEYPEYFENYSSPTIDRDGNIIFQTSTEDSGYIYSVDYYSNLNWKTTLGHYWEEGAEINHGLVCDAEGKIYCGSTVGLTTNFWCMDKNGNILWKLDLEGYQFDSSPAIGSDGTLYIGTHLSSLFNNHQRNLIAIRDTVTYIKDETGEDYSYKLEQNFPNPFNATTHIRYTIPQSGKVILKVYDLMGSEITMLLDRYQAVGEYDVIFQPKNLKSGIYFYQLQAGKYVETKKMILLK